MFDWCVSLCSLHCQANSSRDPKASQREREASQAYLQHSHSHPAHRSGEPSRAGRDPWLGSGISIALSSYRRTLALEEDPFYLFSRIRLGLYSDFDPRSKDPRRHNQSDRRPVYLGELLFPIFTFIALRQAKELLSCRGQVASNWTIYAGTEEVWKCNVHPTECSAVPTSKDKIFCGSPTGRMSFSSKVVPSITGDGDDLPRSMRFFFLIMSCQEANSDRNNNSQTSKMKSRWANFPSLIAKFKFL